MTAMVQEEKRRARPEKLLFTVPEVAAIMRLTGRSIWRFGREGKLKLVKFGGRTYVHRDEVERLLTSGVGRRRRSN